MSDLLTIEEAARYLRVSKSWIYHRTGPQAKMRPIIPHATYCRTLLFDPKDLEAIRSGRRIGSLKIEENRNAFAQIKERTLEHLW